MTTEDFPEFPVEGMTKIPYGHPAMTGAFLACATATIAQPGVPEAFKAATGHDLSRLTASRGIAYAVDKATGYQKAVFTAFLDWVAETVWGLEWEEMPDEI